MEPTKGSKSRGIHKDNALWKTQWNTENTQWKVFSHQDRSYVIFRKMDTIGEDYSKWIKSVSDRYHMLSYRYVKLCMCA